jgi:predicted DNA-binding transcriptional regulator AlpA
MQTNQIDSDKGTGGPPSKYTFPERSNGPVLLNYEQLSELGICYSKEHIRNMEKDGLFPVRVRLSPKRVAWDRQEISDWLQERLNARTAVSD